MNGFDTFYADPPLAQWETGGQGESADRVALCEKVNFYAARFGTAPLKPTLPIIATGHQAWFWHPGILAKDIAMTTYANSRGGGAGGAGGASGGGGVHLVVDHDVHPMTSVVVPVVQGQTLQMQTVRLSSQPEMSGVPGVGLEAVEDWQLPEGEQFEPLKNALGDLPVCDNLAQQVGVLLCRLMERWVGPVSFLFATDLMQLPVADRFFERVLSDPRKFVQTYNAAVATDPGAGVLPLTVEPDRIELPVWLVAWQKPRQRVYVDIADSKPLLVDETGEVVNLKDATLAPRALLLTALMRSALCDLFIHGKGGWRYDKMTEHWWTSWTGQELCPMVTVSADLYLDFDVPRGDAVEKAVWYQHHLPHNLDRYAPVDISLGDRKRAVLKAMAASQDPTQKATLFKQLHAINTQLGQQHSGLLEQAHQQVHHARRDHANGQIMQKRDWPFWLYPVEQLEQLVDRVRASLSLR